MGLTDIILAADDAILNKFQSVTDTAAKYGYTKYDLAVMCQKTAGVSIFGSFSYGVCEYVLTSDYANASIAALFSFLGITIYYESKEYRNKEEQELRQITLEILAVPEQDRRRLFAGVVGTVMLGYALNYALGGVSYSEKELQVMGASERNILGALYDGLYSIGAYSLASAKYFAGTTMVPPKTKKLHQRLYEKVKSLVSAPVLEGKKVSSSSF